MDKVIALDVGSVRIGVAASDALGLTAQALETWKRKGLENDLQHFDELAETRGAAALPGVLQSQGIKITYFHISFELFIRLL